jgi:hypothetical protein
MPENWGKNTDTLSYSLVLTASLLVIALNLAKSFAATLTKTEKLRNDLSVITICFAILFPKEGYVQTDILLFQCSLSM